MHKLKISSSSSTPVAFAKTLAILFLICFNFSLADTDPIFHDNTNIQQFLKGYLEGLNLQIDLAELSSITDKEFALDEFMLGLDFQGLSILISEKEQLGLQHISNALVQFDDSLPQKSQSLQVLIDKSLKVFGNYKGYAEAKQQYEEIYPSKDVSSFLWDALDFISLNNNFNLSGKMVATIVNALLPLIN